jgi:threonine aldolase
LGAPVGSMIVGSKDLSNAAALFVRCLGSMRQVGVLAAAGLVALEEAEIIACGS